MLLSVSQKPPLCLHVLDVLKKTATKYVKLETNKGNNVITKTMLFESKYIKKMYLYIITKTTNITKNCVRIKMNTLSRKDCSIIYKL